MLKIEALNPQYAAKTAYICGEKRLTYAKLYEKAERVAAVLKAQGGGAVAVLGNKEPEMIISILACIMAHRAYVPLEDNLPQARIEAAVKQAGCTLVLKNGSACPDCCIPCSTLAELEHTPDKAACGGAQNAKMPTEQENNGAQNETAYIIFTSGSTGTPKGVPISYANLENFIRWICSNSTFAKFEHAAVFCPASFGFDLSVAGIYYTLANGGTLITVSREEQKSFDGIFTALQKSSAEIAVLTPTFMKLCLLNGDFNAENFPKLRCCWFCGERLEKALCEKLLRRFPSLKIINAYGPTEATCAVCSAVITAETLAAGEPLPVGDISSAACKIEIENGEIILSGTSVFGGYIGAAERTGGRFATGDLGEIRGGKLYCTGRADGRIKYKGYRIELGDIEANILAIDGVRACCAVAKRSKNGDTAYIKVFVSAEPTLGEETLRTALKYALPEYMIPKVIEFLPQLPVNEHGKTDRRLLEHYEENL